MLRPVNSYLISLKRSLLMSTSFHWLQELQKFRFWSAYRNQLLSPLKFFHKSVCNSTPLLQIVHVPVPQIQEQPAVPDLVTCVEASQVVGSLLPLRELVAPMCNQVLQEQIAATVQPHDRFQEIPEVQVLERIQVSTDDTHTRLTSIHQE